MYTYSARVAFCCFWLHELWLRVCAGWRIFSQGKIDLGGLTHQRSYVLASNEWMILISGEKPWMVCQVSEVIFNIYGNCYCPAMLEALKFRFLSAHAILFLFENQRGPYRHERDAPHGRPLRACYEGSQEIVEKEHTVWLGIVHHDWTLTDLI